MITSFSYIFQSLCIALASLTSSAVYGALINKNSPNSKKKFVQALLLGAVAGTLILTLGTFLPYRINPIRQILIPESALEGNWIQVHKQNGIPISKYSIATITFDPSSQGFRLDGWSYKIDIVNKEVVERSHWKSENVLIKQGAECFDLYYIYDADLYQSGGNRVEGFGWMNFKEMGLDKWSVTGHYKDSRDTAKITDFEMIRIKEVDLTTTDLRKKIISNFYYNSQKWQ